MLVYKYRGGSDDDFNRDLSSIERNYFWGSDINQLNDPWETIIKSEKFIKQSKSVSWFFGKNSHEKLLKVHEALENLLSFNKRIGIYSLSTNYLDELLWAHYANSHKGFCIEYDLDILLNTFRTEKVYHFPVKYNKIPPEVTISDVNIKNDSLIRKLSGFKSKRWEYEQEYRIITDNSGKQSYNHQALKSIYFGLRMSETHKSEIFKRLKGRDIKFYQIEHLNKSYKFEAARISNPFGEDIDYLKFIPASITNNKNISFEIIEQNFYKHRSKGVITIMLESIIKKSEIEWLANKIYDEIFHTAEKVFILYYFKEQKNMEVAWATSHFINGKLEIKINDFILSM
ncbi:DUF2971 domain-containing protein [Flavobacterium salilacus subsp. salilacus]|uniref:DUF2971 domain-containing protein n=1 Tax=Flavobacterium TaxID=237 RepID=UPI001075309F|nr:MULTISPECIES: DUF2971 domain-containing protein [Flavobacterium]KAF2519004.1 DUF2971 domain-containing protein [Flavobacterium salilacus subsp. salilacus]MBE1614833.1 DUF2971 domain-containing protein [Flavobacterium sp. SaA2.13]